MTKATVLAGALVEAGILKDRSGGIYEIVGQKGREYLVTANEAVDDWRVAGKVLESMESLQIGFAVLNHGGSYELFHSPRAIIEAWYEATRQ